MFGLPATCFSPASCNKPPNISIMLQKPFQVFPPFQGQIELFRSESSHLGHRGIYSRTNNKASHLGLKGLETRITWGNAYGKEEVKKYGFVMMRVMSNTTIIQCLSANM
ncbi:hypothetical protein SLA2020_312800 [Shorea laevis]